MRAVQAIDLVNCAPDIGGAAETAFCTAAISVVASETVALVKAAMSAAGARGLISHSAATNASGAAASAATQAIGPAGRTGALLALPARSELEEAACARTPAGGLIAASGEGSVVGRAILFDRESD